MFQELSQAWRDSYATPYKVDYIKLLKDSRELKKTNPNSAWEEVVFSLPEIKNIPFAIALIGASVEKEKAGAFSPQRIKEPEILALGKALMDNKQVSDWAVNQTDKVIDAASALFRHLHDYAEVGSVVRQQSKENYVVEKIFSLIQAMKKEEEQLSSEDLVRMVSDLFDFSNFVSNRPLL